MLKTIISAFEKYSSSLDLSPLRLRIFLSVILTLPLVFLGSISYIHTYRVLTRAVMNERGNAAQLSADIVQDRLDKLTTLALALSGRPRVVEFAVQERWDEAIKVLQTIPREFPFIQGVGLYDINGTCKAGTPAGFPVGKQFSSRDWFREVSRHWLPYASEVYHRQATPEVNIIGVAAPIKYSIEDGKIVPGFSSAESPVAGILNMHIRVEVLGEWAKDLNRMSKGVKVHILDKNANLIYHPDILPQGPIVKYTNTFVIERLLKGENGIKVLFDPGIRQMVLIAFYPVPQHQFSIILEEPVAQAFKDRDRQLVLLLFIYISLLVFSQVVSYFIVRVVVLRKAVDAVIAESERKYRGMFNSLRDGILRVTMDGMIQETNERLETMLGYTSAELRQLSYQELAPDEWKASTQKIIQEQTIGRGYSDEYEKEYLRKDGTRVPISVKSWLIKDEHGKNVGMWGIIRDISERKRLEAELHKYSVGLENLVTERTKELRQSEERFRRAFNDSPFPMIIHAEDGEVVRINREWSEITGYTHEEIPTIEAWTLRAYGERKKYVKEDIEKLYGLEGRVKEGEYTVSTKSGVVRVWDFSSAPLGKLPDGRRIVLSMAMDITERKKAEEALRLTQFSVDRAADSVLWIKQDARFIYANDQACKRLGYSREELLRMSVFDVDPVFPKEKWPEHWKEIEQRGSFVFESKHRAKNGEIFPVDISVNLIQHGDKKYNCVFARDITVRKKAEEEISRLNQELEIRVFQRTAQLEEANRELEAFSYSVSHDLRAPLRSMDGFSQAVLEDYQDKLDGKGKNYLARIRQAAQRMAELIEDLLNLSRVGRSAIRFEEVDLGILAKQIIEEMRAVDQGREVTATIGQNLVVQADGHLMRVLLDNLLRNAWKFTSKTENASITFDKTTIDGKQVFFVRDNGAGFDRHYVDKLFNSFSRLHSETEFPGSGIGLALVRRIVNRHEGKVWAQGAIGKGATFYFRLF